ncbi:MAG TPA: hypothetical protein VN679_08430 [Candidatus Acidoferrales bacterium]|nr:hypothetical protein [Candidatus Acidoferrales bacterium]
MDVVSLRSTHDSQGTEKNHRAVSTRRATLASPAWGRRKRGRAAQRLRNVLRHPPEHATGIEQREVAHAPRLVRRLAHRHAEKTPGAIST